MYCCIAALVVLRCIALYCCIAIQWVRDRACALYWILYSNTAEIQYIPLYSKTPSGALGSRTEAMVVMVRWEPEWVRVTAHVSQTFRTTQESIAKLRDAPTRWSRQPWPPRPRPVQCSRLCSNTAGKRAVLGNTAPDHCPAPTVLQCSNTAQYSAIQRNTAYSNTTQYSIQHN